jgi:Flp pilus assembly protein TadD
LPEALEYFEQAVETDPGELSAWNNKGLVLSRLGREGEAMACFSHARSLNRRQIR